MKKIILLLIVLIVVSSCSKQPTECIDYKDVEERANCFIKKAKIEKNWEICNQIPDTVGQNLCFTQLASFLTDENICNQIVDQSHKDNCFGQLGRQEKNEDLCMKIISTSDRDFCLSRVARFTLNPETCSKIELDIKAKDGCYFESSEKHQNYELCLEIQDKSERINCLFDRAFELKDKTICNHAPVLNWGQCYGRVAKSIGDVSLCDELETESNRENCKFEFSV